MEYDSLPGLGLCTPNLRIVPYLVADMILLLDGILLLGERIDRSRYHEER